MIDLFNIKKQSPNKPLIKVCGMTQKEQVEQLVEIGIDFCGFIFYSNSKRFVTPHLTNSQIACISTEINKIGVFVNETFENILKIVNECKLDAVQLHGNESPEFCSLMAKEVTTIKAIGVTNSTNINEITSPFVPYVHALLFDTKDENSFGGTGKKFDWTVLGNSKIDIPYFLSGGISPLDVGEIRHFRQIDAAKKLFALDVNSKFEKKFGVKDIKTIKNFVIGLNSSR